MSLRPLPFLFAALLAAPAVAADPSADAPSADAPSADEFLAAGRLAEGETALAAHLAAHPDDREARFGLGTVQFLQSVERLGRFLHKHGAIERTRRIPFFRIPLPDNPNPEPTTYADYRGMLEAYLADLAEAEATLSLVNGEGAGGDVKLPIRFGLVRLDFDGDGVGSDEEALWRIYANLNAQFRNQEDLDEKAKEFRIAFDAGDVSWLRGYCHLLSALVEVQLAYDGQRWFDHCGHLLFAKAESPYPFLARTPAESDDPFQPDLFMDLIAAIHLIDFDLKEPGRMAAARGHLLAMTALSRESWDAILAETDDDHEWLPNPKQHSVVGVPVSAEMITGWRAALDEFDAVLNGEKLVPFWRDEDRGVNLKRVFTEPRAFDLVLWVQGTAAAPYLEQGETTSTDTWGRLTGLFRGEFIGFAIWFN